MDSSISQPLKRKKIFHSYEEIHQGKIDSSVEIKVERIVGGKEEREAEENEVEDEIALSDAEISQYSEEIISLHANDHINLVFHSFSNDLVPVLFRVHPTFTHQLFPNEVISYLTREQIKHLQIDLHIQNCDLLHWVSIHGLNDSEINEKIYGSLQPALPEGTIIMTQNESLPNFDKPCSNCICYAPIGTSVHSFRQTREAAADAHNSNTEIEYEIFLATYQDSHANTLLTRLEKLAMWFIETADAVDFSDPRWEVLFLYRKVKADPSHTNHESPKYYYYVEGYMTLFTFHNPFHGDNLRVCQALIFPEQQHYGLGREMLLTVYRLAAERQTIIQVTIEDPSPGFQQLRNTVDFEWFIQKYSLQPKVLQASTTTTTEKIVLPSSKEISEELKIIKSQASFIREAFEYIEMIASLQSKSDVSPLKSSIYSNVAAKERLESLLSGWHEAVLDHPHFPEFRLAVKRNLVKSDPELKALPKTQLQKELSVAFEEKMMKFRIILRSAVRLQLIPNHLGK